MFRSGIIEVGIVSSLIGIITEAYGIIELSYIILVFFIMIDTITGIFTAIKYKRFSSRGISQLARKIVTYSLSVLTVRLLEVGIAPIYQTTILSHIFFGYLMLIEVISILENLTLLGVPIPDNLISLLIKHIRIPGINKLINKSEHNIGHYLEEIDEILTYQLPTISNVKLQHLIQICLSNWQRMTLQFNYALKEKDSNDLIYYKVSSIIELGLMDIEKKWQEEKTSQELIKSFQSNHLNKISKYHENTKKICYLNIDLQEKKRQLINEVIILLYQMVIDARKVK